MEWDGRSGPDRLERGVSPPPRRPAPAPPVVSRDRGGGLTDGAEPDRRCAPACIGGRPGAGALRAQQALELGRGRLAPDRVAHGVGQGVRRVRRTGRGLGAVGLDRLGVIRQPISRHFRTLIN